MNWTTLMWTIMSNRMVREVWACCFYLYIYSFGGEYSSQEIVKALWNGEFISIHLQLMDASPRALVAFDPTVTPVVFLSVQEFFLKQFYDNGTSVSV